jgi:ribosomal protein S21
MMKEGSEAKLLRMDMVEVRVDGDGLERALVQLRNKLLRDRIFQEVRARETPSRRERVKAKHARALHRLMKHKARRAKFETERPNEAGASYKFIRKDGNVIKVYAKQREIYQHG